MSTLHKYPRTPHLPLSPGATSDDKWASEAALAHLGSGIDLVVTEKQDGGNVSFYRDAFHGRSLTSGTHAWDTATKAVWARVCHDIPQGWRISGESMYARRSVAYENLPGAYLVFGIWDGGNNLLSWDDTEEWAGLLGLPTVPVIGRTNSLGEAQSLWFREHNPETSEGFVVRNAGSFSMASFDLNIAKYVRADHVRTRADWRHRDDFAVNGFVEGALS